MRRPKQKFPVPSVLTLLIGYGTIGWLLAIYSADWRVWTISGAIAFATEWFLALAWALAAIVLLFSTKAQALPLAVGICLIWALLMYVARIEVQAFSENKIQSFFILAFIAGLGMALGWFTDISFFPSIGDAIMKGSQ
jgi:hypothetical protein